MVKRVIGIALLIVFLTCWFLFGTTFGGYVVEELTRDTSPLPEGLRRVLGIVSWIFVAILFVFRRFFWWALFQVPIDSFFDDDNEDSGLPPGDDPARVTFTFTKRTPRRPEVFKDGRDDWYPRAAALCEWLEESWAELGVDPPERLMSRQESW